MSIYVHSYSQYVCECIYLLCILVHSQYRTSPLSQEMLSLPISSCHILSISGTPLLPLSPPHSSFTHMIQCLATENRKAGGYFIQYLQSLADRVSTCTCVQNSILLDCVQTYTWSVLANTGYLSMCLLHIYVLCAVIYTINWHLSIISIICRLHQAIYADSP